MRFNVRVYGLLIHEDHILVTDENRFNTQFTKFPGGGLEFEEGILDCLKREFQEELQIEIHSPQLFYINEDFVVSAFRKEDQIQSIYYFVACDQTEKIETKEKAFDFKGEEQIFRWIHLNNLNSDEFRFPIDKIVVGKLAEFYNS